MALKGGTLGVQFFRRPSHMCFYRSTNSDQIQHRKPHGTDVFDGISHDPYPQGVGPSGPKFLGPLRAVIRFELERPNLAQ